MYGRMVAIGPDGKTFVFEKDHKLTLFEFKVEESTGFNLLVENHDCLVVYKDDSS